MNPENEDSGWPRPLFKQQCSKWQNPKDATKTRPVAGSGQQGHRINGPWGQLGGGSQEQLCALYLPRLFPHLKTKVALLLHSHKVLATGLGQSRHANRRMLPFKRKGSIVLVPKKEGRDRIHKEEWSQHSSEVTPHFNTRKEEVFSRHETRTVYKSTDHLVQLKSLNQNTKCLGHGHLVICTGLTRLSHRRFYVDVHIGRDGKCSGMERPCVGDSRP